MQFPSFKTAPAKKDDSFKSLSKPTSRNPYEDLVMVDAKADEDFFRYGRFKQAPIINERTPDEIMDESIANRNQLKPNLPLVNFSATDKSSLRRLAYCVQDDADGNIFFGPEILNIISNEKAPSSFNENDSDYLINYIESCLEGESAVNVLQRALEKFPNHPLINSMALYYGIRECVDFESYKVDYEENSIPIFLYQSGYTERFAKMLGIKFDVSVDDLPLNVPGKVRRKLLVDFWLKTEGERSERFCFSHSPAKILCDDPFEDDPERAPFCYHLELSPQERLKMLIEAITGFALPEIQQFSGLLRLEISPFEKFLLHSYFPGNPYFVDQVEPKHICHTTWRDYEVLTNMRNQVQNAALESPLDPQIIEKFISFESTLGCTFRVRHWILESWNKFKHDAPFIIFISHSLTRHLPDFSQSAFLEKSVRLHFSDPRIWLQYLNVTSDPTRIAYRAINAIPYHKKLYMKAIQRVPDEKDKIILISLMELKGLRIRTFLEEFDLI